MYSIIITVHSGIYIRGESCSKNSELLESQFEQVGAVVRAAQIYYKHMYCLILFLYTGCCKNEHPFDFVNNKIIQLYMYYI